MDRYQRERKRLHSELPQKEWFDWSTSEAMQFRTPPTYGFNVSVVAYERPRGAKVGLSRRDALKLLAARNLREPTHAELFAFSSEEIILRSLEPVFRHDETSRQKVWGEPQRPTISVPVSINPEYPFYYSFTMRGVKGHLVGFTRHRFSTVSGHNTLYFAPHYTGTRSSGCDPFPLLLGVDHSSRHEYMMSAKKAISLGESSTESYGKCRKCSNPQTICIGSQDNWLTLQCVECNYVFEIDGK